MDQKPNIFDLGPEELRAVAAQAGLPAYRAKQVLEWVYRHGVLDFEGMTSLGRVDKERLAEAIRLGSGQVVGKQLASDGTEKLLLQWDCIAGKKNESPLAEVPDPARQTECVMIPTDERRTACVSSQVGCPVGCRFCASGLGGLDGNLTAGQIVEQVWRLSRWETDAHARTTKATENGRITNVVFMGMGEPLANLEQVIAAVGVLSADWGMGISQRKITISTVGLPAQMRRLADENLSVTLAISLHAPNDTIRRQLIPWAEFVTIDQLCQAGQYYFERTGREVTLEYLLLGGVNDQPAHARELAEVARQLRSNVNLIRYNQVTGLGYRRPKDQDVHRFAELLKKAGVNTHIRASRGRDIAAACGQLRHESAKK
ncbi:MAG: 23S rRNA (adenine(2503)-C(2))-methyltransferase RlmN [Phycisphaeraceae bacterium]|nr:23S rRNA (adenine(2503)-C(2))-methyltransferase RlmN [Phycisphaeraceae bacterium]